MFGRRTKVVFSAFFFSCLSCSFCTPRPIPKRMMAAIGSEGFGGEFDKNVRCWSSLKGRGSFVGDWVAGDLV